MNGSRAYLPVHPIPVELVCDPMQRVSSTIERFKSSHVPLFAYESGRLRGLLTLDEALLRRKYKPGTLIRTRLTTPPFIRQGSDPFDVLQNMYDLKLYVIPVFDEDKRVAGLVHAKELLRLMIEVKSYYDIIARDIKLSDAVSIREKDTVGDAFRLFAQHRVSRLIVVDPQGRATGIITKRDILSHFQTPSNKQRFDSNHAANHISFDEEKWRLIQEDDPVSKYANPLTQIISEKTTAHEAIRMLLDSRFHALVVADNLRRPRSVLSMRGLLKTALESVKGESLPNIIISNVPDRIPEQERNQLGAELKETSLWIGKQKRVQKVEFSVNVIYSSSHEPSLFEASLRVKTDRGDYVARSKSRYLIQATRIASREIKKQVERN